MVGVRTQRPRRHGLPEHKSNTAKLWASRWGAVRDGDVGLSQDKDGEIEGICLLFRPEPKLLRPPLSSFFRQPPSIPPGRARARARLCRQGEAGTRTMVSTPRRGHRRPVGDVRGEDTETITTSFGRAAALSRRRLHLRSYSAASALSKHDVPRRRRQVRHHARGESRRRRHGMERAARVGD